MENWKDIAGYEGQYQVSDLGRVKSLARTWVGGKGAIRTHEGKILADACNADYRQVVLTKDGKQKTIKVHRLVAQAFIPNPNNLPEVNHKNGIKFDNWVKNLEWNTKLENMQHASINNFFGERGGEKNGCNKLTEEQIFEIKDKYIPWKYTQDKLAKEYGVDRMTILRIINNQTWKHVTQTI